MYRFTQIMTQYNIGTEKSKINDMNVLFYAMFVISSIIGNSVTVSGSEWSSVF